MLMSSKYPDISTDDDIEKTGEMFENVNEQQNKQEVLRRMRQVQYDKQFGTERGKGATLREWDKQDYQHRVLVALEDIADLEQKRDTRERAEQMLGKVYSSRMTLVADTKFTHIDFTVPNASYGIPANSRKRFPLQKAKKLRIYNETGGGVIEFGTNMQETEHYLPGLILSGKDEEIEAGAHDIVWLDIRVESGANATVVITAFV